MEVTFIGHSTVLLKMSGTQILTDPVFSERIFFIHRRSPIKIAPETIEPSAILISHAHYDHLDIPSLKYFRSTVPIILPVGLAPLLSKFVKNPLIEIAHHSSYHLEDDTEISAFPVKHVGFRISGFRYRTCNGYLIRKKGESVFFPGDSAYTPKLSEAVQGQPIDLALLPIGCYEPAWFMKNRHLNPEEAVQLFEELGAKVMIPIHWGTFPLSFEPLGAPLEWILRLQAEKGLGDRLRILKHGESIKLTPPHSPS